MPGGRLSCTSIRRTTLRGVPKRRAIFGTTCRGSAKPKAAVFGISILDEASKARFAKKYDVTFPLLADEDHAVAEKYGVWQQKSLYGRKFMGNVRTTYLIGPDGKVAKRWDNVKVDGHAEDVLSVLGLTN